MRKNEMKLDLPAPLAPMSTAKDCGLKFSNRSMVLNPLRVMVSSLSLIIRPDLRRSSPVQRPQGTYPHPCSVCYLPNQSQEADYRKERPARRPAWCKTPARADANSALRTVSARVDMTQLSVSPLPAFYPPPLCVSSVVRGSAWLSSAAPTLSAVSGSVAFFNLDHRGRNMVHCGRALAGTDFIWRTARAVRIPYILVRGKQRRIQPCRSFCN